MSDRRAVKPIDQEAARAADAALAAETGGRPLTMGPEDAALRKKWMDAYVAAGGKVESPKSDKQQPGDPTAPCPLECVDLVIPLEIDLDDNPEQDDRVRLRNEDGSYDRVVSSGDEAATPHEEHPLILYRFASVPPGTYKVQVDMGGSWQTVLAGLKVTTSNATHDGAAYTAEEDGKEFGHPDESPESDEEGESHTFDCSH